MEQEAAQALAARDAAEDAAATARAAAATAQREAAERVRAAEHAAAVAIGEFQSESAARSALFSDMLEEATADY